MKNRGDIDSTVGTLKQSVKDLCAEMNSIKHFEQDHPDALLDLYLAKPSQDWVKELETTILGDRSLAAAETLVCLQELLDTTANQLNFARTLRLERPGLKTAMETTLNGKANSKTLESVHFKDDYSALLETLIEAPLSDEHLVREFTVYDTLREIVEFFAAPPHWRAANYARLKMRLEKRISKWQAEDLLKQDGVALSVLQKFLAYKVEDLSKALGKRNFQLLQAEREISNSGVECSLSESPAMKGKGRSMSQMQSTKNLQCVGMLKPLGFEACYPDGSFLTDKTDEGFYRERSTPVVKEPMKANNSQIGINQLVEDFIDGKQQEFTVGWSGLKTAGFLGSQPHSQMRLKTSSNTCKQFGKDRETQRTIKSGMSSQHLSRSSKDGYPRIEIAATQKLGILPTKLEMGTPNRQLDYSLDRREATGIDNMSNSCRDSVNLARAQHSITIQDAVSKQLTNLNYSEVQQKLKSQDSLHNQQKMLQVLVLGSFDQSRQEAKEKLYQALRKEFGDTQARFQAKKLESDIFSLYYNDLHVYQDKVIKCAANLQMMFKKEWSADHLMSTCIDYELLAAIQTHVQNIVRGGPSVAQPTEQHREANRSSQANADPRIFPVRFGSQLDSPSKPEAFRDEYFTAGGMIVERQGLTREEVFGNSQKENSCVEVSEGMIEPAETNTPWKPKPAHLNENIRSTAETDRRGGTGLLPATDRPQKPGLIRNPSFDMLTDPFADDDLNLSTNSFEFLECIAKIKEAEINLLNQHLNNVMHENELLREALMHVKANQMLLQSIDCEADDQAGNSQLSVQGPGTQLIPGEDLQCFGHQGISSNSLRALPRGEP